MFRDKLLLSGECFGSLFGVFSEVSAFMDHTVQADVVWCCLGPSSSVSWIDGTSIQMFAAFLVDLFVTLMLSNLGSFGSGISSLI